MKSILLIWLFILCNSGLTQVNTQNQHLNVEKMLLGKWALANDKNYVMWIKENSIIYYYKSKVKHKKSIRFLFGDSLVYYRNNNGHFNFMKDNGDIYPGVLIKEYDSLEKDTTDITIVYLDKTGMDLIGKGRTATFKKINPIGEE
jgi:hypothetical protein